MDGILLIDKPRGPSSFQVVHQIKKVTGEKKIGHAGTLDPLAAGLLVVCLGRYTKLAGVLTDDDKAYEAVFRLGITTTTDDEEGEIVEQRSCDHLNEKNIDDALRQFVGFIEQMPPQFSAIKINGVRAYQHARRKETVQLTKRPVHISSIRLLHISPGHVAVEVHCSKGTYIRSLARDVGEVLGVGAHVKAIRRLRSGQFDVANAIKLEEITSTQLSERIFSAGSALHLEMVQVTDEDRKNILHGRRAGPFGLKNEVGIAVFGDELVALLKKENGIARAVRVI